MSKKIYQFLDLQGVRYIKHDHPAVFTCEQAAEHCAELSATNTKNLFLRDRKGKRHFLVVTDHEKAVDLKALGERLETKLSFGSADRLEKHLGVEPGSVTLLALVNDPEHRVEVLIDSNIWAAKELACHPLVNTATLEISRAGLRRFLEATGHKPEVLDLPSRSFNEDSE